MDDIILYANIYVPNTLGYGKVNYIDYLKIVVDIQQKALLSVPYNNIVVEKGMVKYMCGSINPTNKIFQYRCRLFDIDFEELNDIKKSLTENGFFNINSIVTNSDRDTKLYCENSKEENIINKLALIANGEYNNFPKTPRLL